MQRRPHGHGGKIGRAVTAGSHLVESGKIGNPPQLRNAARSNDGAADIVDQLVLDQILGVPDRVEDLAHGKRRDGMLADQLEDFLVLGRGYVFQPEQLVRLEHLAEVGGLLRGIAMVAIVQQVMVEAVSCPQLIKQLGHIVQRQPRVPAGHAREGGIGRFMVELAAADAISVLDARHAGLRADRLVAKVDVLADGIGRFFDVRAVGVAIDHHPVTAAPAEQLVERHACHLCLDVPQRHVDGRNRSHRHWPAPPVGTAIEVLPDILDPLRVHSDQARDDVLFEVGDDLQLPPVQCRVADAINALIGFNLQRDEITPRAADDDPGDGNLHDRDISWLWIAQDA